MQSIKQIISQSTTGSGIGIELGLEKKRIEVGAALKERNGKCIITVVVVVVLVLVIVISIVAVCRGGDVAFGAAVSI